MKRALVHTAFLFAAAFASAQTIPATKGDVAYELDTAWPKLHSGEKLGAVSGVAVDADDSVWVFKRTKPFVQIYDAAGNFVRAWENVNFTKPHHIRLMPDSSVWCADYMGQVVKKFTRDGAMLMTLGTQGKAGCDATHFDLPTDIAIAPDAGDIFISDGYGNARIARFDKDGKFVSDFGKHGAASGEMNLPHALVMDSAGRLYEADRDNGRLQVFEQSGKLLAVWDFITPWGLWMAKGDVLWVCGTAPKPKNVRIWKSNPPVEPQVMKLNTAGEILGQWKFQRGVDDKCRPGELSWVHCIAVDSHENLYLGDVRGNGLQKFVKQARAH